MDAARVSTEEELSFCRNPLNKNRDFILAKRRVSPERRERLLRIQEMQADMYFLRERAKWGRRLEIVYFTANTLVISSLVFLFYVGWMIYDFVVRCIE